MRVRAERRQAARQGDGQGKDKDRSGRRWARTGHAQESVCFWAEEKEMEGERKRELMRQAMRSTPRK